MDTEELRRQLRTQSGIRVGPRTAEYAARQLQARQNAFPLMGADARTGIARSLAIEPEKFNRPASSPSPEPFPESLFG